jgi:hypothetical protein
MRLKGKIQASATPEPGHFNPVEIKILNGATDIISPEIEYGSIAGDQLSSQFHLAVLVTDGMMRENSIVSYLLSADSEEELISALEDGVDVPLSMDVWSGARNNQGQLNGLSVQTKFFSPS